jgi:hypothetical protein
VANSSPELVCSRKRHFHISPLNHRIQALAFIVTTTAAGPLDSASFDHEVLPLLDQQCFDCHDEVEKKGGLDLSVFKDEAAVMKDRKIWRSVYEKVESHQMPPPKRKSQPAEQDRQRLMEWIRDMASRPDPEIGAIDPGKPMLRRLTRLEYNNTLRDLFGLEIDIFMFPDRLPITNKAYFQPSSGSLGDEEQVPVREYGLKYPVLLPELGLPGENRA